MKILNNKTPVSIEIFDNIIQEIQSPRQSSKSMVFSGKYFFSCHRLEANKHYFSLPWLHGDTKTDTACLEQTVGKAAATPHNTDCGPAPQ